MRANETTDKISCPAEMLLEFLMKFTIAKDEYSPCFEVELRTKRQKIIADRSAGLQSDFGNLFNKIKLMRICATAK